MITKNNTFAEVVRQYPQTIGLFNELHLDYCCGGDHTMEQGVAGKDVNLEDLLAKLNAAAQKVPAKETGAAASLDAFKELSIPEMLDSLEQTHHVTEREMMGQAEELLNKILIVHYPHHGELLTQLHHLYCALKAELEEHFAKEERLVFPLLRQQPQPDAQTLAYVKKLEEEHSAAGDLIKEIQKLTENFTLPADACITFERTYKTLEALFDDIFIHIFKENSILFPEYEEQAQK